MKTFKPSPYFVSRVMAGVRVYEATRAQESAWTQRILAVRAVRYALTFGGALIGVINVLRMYMAVFSPVLCR